ncbi:MAG: hypothetical protein JNL82_15565 [Myxococcales bacterium]|nr:hypothetical protein [Myxococcales bacterium]
MDPLDTAELLTRLASTGEARLTAIQELARRAEPAATRPFVKLLREELSPEEVDAILGALERIGTRAILPMLQHTARSRPALAERLMALHQSLKRPPPAVAEPGLRWLELDGGRLAVGPRPKVRALATLRELGATHIVTLLSESEGARELGDAVVAAGLGWQWFPLRNGDPPAHEHDPAALAALDAWAALLAAGGSLYLHCAAGIHRTGMLGHALLRRLGRSPGDALRLLGELRPLTAAEAGEHRLAWGHRFAR